MPTVRLYITDEQVEALDRLALANGTTVGEEARKSIDVRLFLLNGFPSGPENPTGHKARTEAAQFYGADM